MKMTRGEVDATRQALRRHIVALESSVADKSQPMSVRAITAAELQDAQQALGVLASERSRLDRVAHNALRRADVAGRNEASE